MSANSITELTISEMREKLDSRSLTSLEITEAFISRMKTFKDLNCFISDFADSAINEAKEADKKLSNGSRAPLLGIPVTVKDMILTKGLKTTCASKILENFIPPYDATVVRKLKEAGAVILGKANLDEFAMGSSNENSAYGPVKNPWNTGHVAGGSSGGSAAAVSASLTPLALGTDTGGSIRQPASFCSVVGIKPTYGRVSRYGVVAFASSLDQVGMFGRTVADCAAGTEAICGHDPFDSTSVNKEIPSFKDSIGKSIKGLRIGVPEEYFIKGMNPEVESSVRDAITKLQSLGAEIVNISLPHTKHSVGVYYVLAPAEASSNLARYDGIRYGHRASNAKDLSELYSRSRSEGFGPEVKRRIMIGTYVLSTGYYDAYYLRAQKVRTLIARDFKNVFDSKCDVIVSPSAPTTAFKLGEKSADPLSMYLTDIFTIPVNLAGLPGLTLPCGFDSQKLPIGLQLIGKPWDEASLFQVASAYESATEWHKAKPPIGSKA